MADFAKVDVKEIKSELPRSSFSEKEIEQLADLILESGGLFRPIILKQIDIESYTVLEGHLEYYAAVRAREKNPRQGEMVNAFIASLKEEHKIQDQIQSLQASEESPKPVFDVTSSIPKSKEELRSSDWISSFETRLSEIREELFQTKRNHEYRFTQLEKNLEEAEKLDLLDLLNTLGKQDLISQLSRCGIPSAKIEAIYNARTQKSNKKFDSYRDVVDSTKNFGDKGMLGLIDAWKRIYSPIK